MPKKFTEKEKEVIRQRLKEEAMNLLNTYGLKKSSVDELVKRVNIPKGTFYLFYESKELLFFEAINELHQDIQKRLVIELSNISDKISVDTLTDILMMLYQEVNQSGLLQILMSSDIELITRKLPEEVVKEHLAQDDFHVGKLFQMLGTKEPKNTEAFSGALRAIFMTMLHKREIGEDVFDESLRLMLRGVIIQMMGVKES